MFLQRCCVIASCYVDPCASVLPYAPSSPSIIIAIATAVMIRIVIRLVPAIEVHGGEYVVSHKYIARFSTYYYY